MKKCSICGHLSEGVRRCPVCRTDVSSLPDWHMEDSVETNEKCIRYKLCGCGHENSEDALVCEKCSEILLNSTIYTREYSYPELSFRLQDGKNVIFPEEGGLVGRSYIGKTEFQEDLYISRRHAKITQQSGKYEMEILSDLNKSQYNGCDLSKGDKVVLKNGDSIVFGFTQFKIVLKKSGQSSQRIKFL